METSWKGFSHHGYGNFVIKEKLKSLKNILKDWNRNTFGHVDRDIEQAKAEIEKLDVKAEERTLSEADVLKRREEVAKYFRSVRQKDSLLYQKAKIKWLREGDVNSSFFHRCTNKRRKNNEIHGLYIDGRWCDTVSDVKTGIKEHFRRRFASQQWNRLRLGDLDFKKLSDEDKYSLTIPFSKEEIKKAVWSCGSTESPGPDGFNFKFIKRFWDVMKSDIECFLHEFHLHGRIVRGGNPSFVVLIPKKKSPQTVDDFRPISLIGCIYKILAKLLANRLNRVLDSVISENQSAFVGKRQILDGVLIINEVVDELKRSGRQGIIFKADFEKAYDTVDWDFIDEMMHHMNFGAKWRMWMWECLSSASTSILVNGSPTEEFRLQRGLRQ